jgi:glycolate oxidase iron-sulfur subunit
MLGRDAIIEEAGRCVKCAYCLPYCPTYRLLAEESDSPRGRIELIRRVAEGDLAPASAAVHLDRCLGCRACERHCPSQVNYAALLAAARNAQRDARPALQQLPAGIFQAALARLPYSPLAARATKVWPWLRPLVQKLLPRYSRLLGKPLTGHHWQEIYPAARPNGRRVALFTGCVARLTEGDVINAGIQLLNRLGYEVAIPQQQGCCGAMARHAGDSRTEQAQCQANRQAFAASGAEAVLYFASGCGIQLQESDPASRQESSQPPALPSREICDFLVADPGLAQLPLRPLKARAALHTPCTHKLLPGRDAPRQLLARIPEIDLHPLAEDGLCCGGAGLYLLTQPALSDRLAENKCQQIQADGAELLLTTNTGCAIQLETSLARVGPRILHPLLLLAQQLDHSPSSGATP